MPQVKIITPPDNIHDSSKSVLLINFDDKLKEAFNEAMKDITFDINIYMYDFERMLDERWLIQTISFIDTIFLNADGLDGHWLLSYILSKSKTFYFSTTTAKPYKLLNANKIYSFTEADTFFKNLKDDKNEG